MDYFIINYGEEMNNQEMISFADLEIAVWAWEGDTLLQFK